MQTKKLDAGDYSLLYQHSIAFAGAHREATAAIILYLPAHLPAGGEQGLLSLLHISNFLRVPLIGIT